MTFPSLIKRLREERQLSQREVAEYIGITRQAIASYENGKREPDYYILIKLADYFNVSADYLLGRVVCRDENAYTVARNIGLIRGSRTYSEFSQSISAKTGVLILPEMLEQYEKCERIPNSGVVKILASYAAISEAFFYKCNTFQTLELEKEMHKRELQRMPMDMYEGSRLPFGYLESNLLKWLYDEENVEYVKLAKEIKEAGLSPVVLKPLIDSVKMKK